MAVLCKAFDKNKHSHSKKTGRFIPRETSEPVGTGAFGPTYAQFIHKPQEAIAHLRHIQDGEAIAALHPADIGDID